MKQLIYFIQTTDVEEIALRIEKLPKENKLRPRIVIITQGHEPVICATGNNLKLLVNVFISL